MHSMASQDNTKHGSDMLILIFCDIDDFCQTFEPELNKFLLATTCKNRIRSCRISLSEVMTIIVQFHRSGYRCFKNFYLKSIMHHYRHLFPEMVSYNRFVELMPKALLALCPFMKSRYGKATGISYIDSTGLSVCTNKRIRRHKTFRDDAGRGKSSTGWFYRFKLHLIVSDTGEILNVKCTSGNTDDRSVLDEMCSVLFGKLFGDKGYISKEKTELLLDKYGVDLIITHKKNMKPRLITLFDKLLLRGRSIIEIINDQLKNIYQIEHSRHRSKANFMVNLISGLIAYTYKEKKPSLNIVHAGVLPL